MRIRLLTIIAASLSLCGCFDIQSGESVAESCTTTGFTSHIVFLVSSEQGLPNVISGQVNDSVSFDECQAADSFLYTIVRTSPTQAQVSIWLPDTSKVFDQYFDENHQPKASPEVAYKIYGRPYCDDDVIIMKSGTTQLDWHPLFTNKTSCPTAGYSAVVE